MDAIRAFEKRFAIKPGVKSDAEVGPIGNDGMISVSDGASQITLRSSDLKMLWYTRYPQGWPKPPSGQKFKTFGDALAWAETELKPEYAPLKLKLTTETRQRDKNENLKPDEIVRIVWREDRGPIQVVGGNQVEIQARAGDGLVTTFVYLSDYEIEENKTPKISESQAIEKASSQLGFNAKSAKVELVYTDSTPGTKKDDKILTLSYVVSNGYSILVNATTGEVNAPHQEAPQNEDEEPSLNSGLLFLAVSVFVAAVACLLYIKINSRRG